MEQCETLSATLNFFAAVAVSHEVVPIEGYVPRGQTTVADAYLAVLVSRYVERLVAELAALTRQLRGQLARHAAHRLLVLDQQHGLNPGRHGG